MKNTVRNIDKDMWKLECSYIAYGNVSFGNSVQFLTMLKMELLYDLRILHFHVYLRKMN